MGNCNTSSTLCLACDGQATKTLSRESARGHACGSDFVPPIADPALPDEATPHKAGPRLFVDCAWSSPRQLLLTELGRRRVEETCSSAPAGAQECADAMGEGSCGEWHVFHDLRLLPMLGRSVRLCCSTREGEASTARWELHLPAGLNSVECDLLEGGSAASSGLPKSGGAKDGATTGSKLVGLAALAARLRLAQGADASQEAFGKALAERGLRPVARLRWEPCQQFETSVVARGSSKSVKVSLRMRQVHFGTASAEPAAAFMLRRLSQASAETTKSVDSPLTVYVADVSIAAEPGSGKVAGPPAREEVLAEFVRSRNLDVASGGAVGPPSAGRSTVAAALAEYIRLLRPKHFQELLQAGVQPK
mmetsp:Transcript_972/g.2471  ORF Transcript_972/g.2471 Transcript_972/m.2471 type:complete len:364 (-) Transcript_972:46-1137(-)